MTDLGLVFAEEEFDSHGGPPVVSGWGTGEKKRKKERWNRG